MIPAISRRGRTKPKAFIIRLIAIAIPRTYNIAFSFKLLVVY